MKKDVFDSVGVRDYHSILIHSWLRLVKDGMVKKDDESMFTDLGQFFVSFVDRSGRLPDYSNVVDWISTNLI